jgi:hypothetical protein
MANKKVQDNIDTGLWAEDSNGIIASAWWDLGGTEDGGQYILNYHKGQMPAFGGQRYQTLDALEIAMREFEPDMRKWHVKFDE